MDINKLFDLSDRVVVITGAAGLLGTQYAYGLSQAGANVVLADLNHTNCKTIERQIIKKFSTKPMSIKLDLTNQKSISSMTSAIIKKLLHQPNTYLRDLKDPSELESVKKMFNLEEPPHTNTNYKTKHVLGEDQDHHD